MKSAAAFLAERYPFVNELLTKRLALVVAVGAGLILATNAGVFAYAIATAKDHVTIFGPIVGGDFVVFDTAASAASSGNVTDLYDPDNLEARLKAAFPARESFRLSWLYPPTMFLVLLPLAFAPYLSSFALWAAATGGLFLFTMRSIWRRRLALFLIAASPAAFQTLITGQTGFLTAALLAGAAFCADRRWVVAGLAAGLLAVKPQFGLLLPIAFIAGGCWRAFAVAAATALAMAAASTAMFGADAWIAFIDAVSAHGESMRSSIFPFHKLVSAYGGAVMLGASTSLAMAMQFAATLALAGFIALVWRRVKDWDLRLAVLCAAAPLASPYAFYYELTIALPALLVIARRGVETGWLSGEKIALTALWIAPMFVLSVDAAPGVPIGFALSLATFLLAARRAIAALPTRAGRTSLVQPGKTSSGL